MSPDGLRRSAGAQFVGQAVPDVLKRRGLRGKFVQSECAKFVPLPVVAPRVIPSASATSGRDLGGWLWILPERSEPVAMTGG